MSLSSWALVMAHHREGDNAHAGFIYLIMASFGTRPSCLLSDYWPAPTETICSRQSANVITQQPRLGLVLALALIGAGSKAGLVPLHVWLPLAHPAAPSHVSALMSGVMTKVAIYGFIRIVMDLLGSPQWWWAIVLLVIGAITAVLGVLHALMEKDIKRLLAYSTVENVGIIFIGLGLTLAFAGQRPRRRGGTCSHGGSAACPQPYSLQEPAVLRRRRRAGSHPRARYRADGRIDSPHAANKSVRCWSGQPRFRHCRHSTASCPNGSCFRRCWSARSCRSGASSSSCRRLAPCSRWPPRWPRRVSSGCTAWRFWAGRDPRQLAMQPRPTGGRSRRCACLPCLSAGGHCSRDC